MSLETSWILFMSHCWQRLYDTGLRSEPRQAMGKTSVYQVAPSHNQETLRCALGDTLEHQSEGLPLNLHRSPNVSPRAQRRVS